PRTSRPSSFSSNDSKAISREIKQNPEANSTRITDDIEKASGKFLSLSTIRRKLIKK
ncbi:MAG: hypothetical protein MHMPM18_003514, partial [Marteilia pararefringens]